MKEKDFEPKKKRLPKNIKREPELTEIEKTERYLSRVGKYLERELIASHDVYPTDHPVSQYVTKVFSETTGAKATDWRIYVTSGWNALNACALPNNVVFISDRLLQLVDSREELEFVLRHEYTHLKQQHILKNVHRSSSRKFQETFDLIKQDIGRNRLHEYEADIRGAAEDGEQGQKFNQYGAIRFLEKTAAFEKQQGGIDLTHGSDFKRLVNMQYMVRLVDSDSLSAELTPLPETIKHSLSLKESGVTVLTKDPFNMDQQAGQNAGTILHEQEQILKKAELDQLLIAAQPLYEQWRQEKNFSAGIESKKIKEKYFKVRANKAVASLAKQLKTALRFERSIPSKDRPFFSGCLAALSAGLPIEDTRDDQSPMRYFQDFDQYFVEHEDSFKTIPEQLKTLAELPYPLKEDPTELCEFLVNGAIDAGMFDESKGFNLSRFMSYCASVTDAIHYSYLENSTITPPLLE